MYGKASAAAAGAAGSGMATLPDTGGDIMMGAFLLIGGFALIAGGVAVSRIIPRGEE